MVVAVSRNLAYVELEFDDDQSGHVMCKWTDNLLSRPGMWRMCVHRGFRKVYSRKNDLRRFMLESANCHPLKEVPRIVLSGRKFF